MRICRSLFLAVISVITAMPVASCVTIVSPYEETYYVTEYITETRLEPYSETVPVTTLVTGEDILTPYISWSNPSLSFNGHDNVWYYGYDLFSLPKHDDEKIKITFNKQQYYEYTTVRVFDMSLRGQVLTPPLIAPGDSLAPAGMKNEILLMKGQSSTYDSWLNLANFKFNYAIQIGSKTDIWLNYDGPYTLEMNNHGKTNLAVIISGPSAPQNTRFNFIRAWSDKNVQYVTRTGERPTPYQLEKKTAKQRTVSVSRQAPFWEQFLPR